MRSLYIVIEFFRHFTHGNPHGTRRMERLDALGDTTTLDAEMYMYMRVYIYTPIVSSYPGNCSEIGFLMPGLEKKRGVAARTCLWKSRVWPLTMHLSIPCAKLTHAASLPLLSLRENKKKVRRCHGRIESLWKLCRG